MLDPDRFGRPDRVLAQELIEEPDPTSVSWLACCASAWIFTSKNPVGSPMRFGSFDQPGHTSNTSFVRRPSPSSSLKRCGLPVPGKQLSSAIHPAVR